MHNLLLPGREQGKKEPGEATLSLTQASQVPAISLEKLKPTYSQSTFLLFLYNRRDPK